MISVNGLELSENQLRYFLYRVFWKQTKDADLNTVSGCEQAATVAVDNLACLDEEWIASEMSEMDRPKPRATEDRGEGRE